MSMGDKVSRWEEVPLGVSVVADAWALNGVSKMNTSRTVSQRCFDRFMPGFLSSRTIQ
jgi:hypothetical protein